MEADSFDESGGLDSGFNSVDGEKGLDFRRWGDRIY